MSDSDDDNDLLEHSIHDCVRKICRKHVLSRSVLAQRIPQWCFGDSRQRHVDLVRERYGSKRAAVPIESFAFFEIDFGPRGETSPSFVCEQLRANVLPID